MSELEIKLAISIVYGMYGREYFQSADTLADMITVEFGCECTPEMVQPHMQHLSIEEEDVILSSKNLGLVY